MRLIPSPAHRTLVVLGYDGVYQAADAVPRVMEEGPIGLEGIDDKLILFMREKQMHPEDAKLLPEGTGWLLVEFGGDSQEEAEEKARDLISRLVPEDRRDWARHVSDPKKAAQLWEVRKSGLAATAHVPKMGETHPGWEDAAVPPERLGAYLRDFRALLDETATTARSTATSATAASIAASTSTSRSAGRREQPTSASSSARPIWSSPTAARCPASTATARAARALLERCTARS